MTRKKTKRQNIYPDDPVTAYARLVTSKQQLAGPLVRAACKRHLDDLVKGPARGLQWDIAAAQRVIGFFSDVLRLNGGEHEGGQFVLEPAQIFIVGSLFGWKTADGYRRFRVAFIEKGKGNGKALAVETPIATPHGWATMGALRSGDTVFDETGKPCCVVVAHPVSDDSVCYRVEFDGGDKIIASAEHLWQLEQVGLRTTADIFEALHSENNSVSLPGNRTIISCEQIESVAVRCITVDSPSGMFLAGRSMVPTHNSPLAAGIGLYMLTADGEPRAEVYAAATKKDQAMVLFRDAVAMVDQSPVLRDAVRKIGGVSPWNLVYQRTSSFFRSIASDDAQSGPRPHCALLDEIHEHPDDMIVEMMRAGTKGRRQALIFMITNSGTDKTSVCWRYHEYTDRIVNGIVEDDSFFGFVCSLDPNDDWKDESIWLKANPLLNVSITLKYLREQVREAIGMPGKQSKVRRLNFCEWVEASNPWIDQDLWNSCEQEIDLTSLHGLPCFGGLDLSGKNDLSSLTLTFRIGSNLVSVSWFWTPKDTMRQREDRDRVPYTLWSEQGHLEATPGKSIDYAFIAKKIGDLAAVFNIKEIAFDRYRIDDLFRELDEAGIEAYVVTGDEDGSGIRMIPHGQGFVDMGRAVDALETSVLNGNIRVQKNPVMTMCAANAVLVEDPAGNRKFDKRKGKSSGRIDGVLSLAMSVRRAGMPVEPERKYQLMFV